VRKTPLPHRISNRKTNRNQNKTACATSLVEAAKNFSSHKEKKSVFLINCWKSLEFHLKVTVRGD
jgi:hypothetical protein